MDYRKTIKLYEEDGTTVMCDFDIILNRAMGVNALRRYPVLIDAMFNGADDVKSANEIEDGDTHNNESDIVKLFKSGKAEQLFAFTDYFPAMIGDLFPTMLDAGDIRVGTREDIIELATECLIYDTQFINGMVDFFTTACVRPEEKKAKKKVKFAMM